MCGAASYAGTCQTFITGSQPFLRKSTIVSLRPTGASAADTDDNNGAPTVSATLTGSVDLDDMDAGEGVGGQDVAFFAQPTLSGVQLSAGTNDLVAARLFCARAGFSGAAYAGRARVRLGDILDLSKGTRVRTYPLRDVLCRR